MSAAEQVLLVLDADRTRLLDRALEESSAESLRIMEVARAGFRGGLFGWEEEEE